MELQHNNMSDALARHAATDASLQRQSQIAETRQAQKHWAINDVPKINK